MRIKKNNRTPYLSRRDQFRLAVMLGLIVLVVVAMDYARRPANYGWLFNTQPAQSSKKDSSAAKEQIDFRPNVGKTQGGLQLTQPRVATDADQYRAITAQAAADGSSNGSSAKQAQHKIKIESRLLEQISDNSVGIRPGERDLMYYMLAKARDIPEPLFKEVARKDVAFSVLMNHSEQFLGQVLTVNGEIRRLNPHHVGHNEYGIDKLYEAWLFNRDSGKSPYRILCTSIPEGIPTGQELGAGTVVTVTGYYFKRYGYPAVGDRLHVAPMIISKGIAWHRSDRRARAEELNLIPYVLGFAGLIAAIASLTLWKFRKSDKEFEAKHLRRITQASDDAILAIDDIPTIDIGESLRELSESDAPDFET